MDKRYKVIFAGKLQEGVDPAQFVHAFAQMFKVPEAQAQKLLDAGRDVTLKDGLDEATATKYRAVMEKLGMVVRVDAAAELTLVPHDEPAAEAATEAEPQEPSGQAEAPMEAAPVDDRERCPKCGSDRIQGDDCLACGIIISRYREKQARLAAEAAEAAPAAAANPYAAPQSDVTPVYEGTEGEMTGPHTVPAGNGWQWIAGGWDHFKQNPLAWIGGIVVWILLMMALSFIPLLGPLAVNLLSPVIIAGFMLGAQAQREGDSFTVGHIFSGFNNNAGKLIVVGLLYLVGTFLIMLVVGLMVGGALFANMGQLQAAEQNPEAAMAMVGPMLLAMLVAMALMIPLLMAYWFAPALVAFEDLGAFEAMKLSFRACLKNMLPFLVYGLITLALMFVAMIPFGLGMLVLSPVMVAAIYVSYRDIFYEPA